MGVCMEAAARAVVSRGAGKQTLNMSKHLLTLVSCLLTAPLLAPGQLAAASPKRQQLPDLDGQTASMGKKVK